MTSQIAIFGSDPTAGAGAALVVLLTILAMLGIIAAVAAA